MRKTLLLLATLALCLTVLLSSGSPGARTSASPAPKAKGQKLHKKEKAIPGHYIVVLDEMAAGAVGEASQAEQLADVLEDLPRHLLQPRLQLAGFLVFRDSPAGRVALREQVRVGVAQAVRLPAEARRREELRVGVDRIGTRAPTVALRGDQSPPSVRRHLSLTILSKRLARESSS